MPFIKVTRQGQITTPSNLQKLIPKSQSYFWAPQWQAAEREAQADIDEGRIKTFESVDDLLADLRSAPLPSE